MQTALDDNRREAYRYYPSPVMEPMLSIVHDGARSRADSVLDINMRGVRVSFEPERAPRVRAGEEVGVSIQAPGLDGCADFGARVVFSAGQEGKQVLALVFTSRPDVADRADRYFFSMFNRRQAERSEDAAAIDAELLPARADGERISIRVVNHSAGGIGFVVDPEVDAIIRGSEAIDIAIRTRDDAREVTARVLHRASRAGTVYYGCTFAG